MVKVKVRFAFVLILALVAVIVVSLKPWEHGGPITNPRPHTPPHVIAQKPNQILRFSVFWERPWTPERVIYHIGGAQVTLDSHQLPADLGHWALEVPYNYKTTYALEVFQTNTESKSTACEIRIIDPTGFGFGDTDRITVGRGTVRCWINAGT